MNAAAAASGNQIFYCIFNIKNPAFVLLTEKCVSLIRKLPSCISAATPPLLQRRDWQGSGCVCLAEVDRHDRTRPSSSWVPLTMHNSQFRQLKSSITQLTSHPRPLQSMHAFSAFTLPGGGSGKNFQTTTILSGHDRKDTLNY